MRPKLAILLFVILFLFGCGEKKQDTWIEHISDKGRFSVSMPGTPQKDIKNISSSFGILKMYTFAFEKPNIAYVVVYTDYPRSVVDNKDPEIMLDGARNGAMQNAGGRLLNEEFIEFGEYPGRELKFEVKGGRGLGRAVILLADTRLYQVMAIGAKQSFPSKTVQKFIDSFEMWD